MRRHESAIVAFQPAAGRKASEKLERLIQEAKDGKAFGDVVWDDLKWEIRKASRASRRGKDELRFWRHQDAAGGKKPFKEPFASFVRAVVCRRQESTIGGLAVSRHEDAIRACRYLYEIVAVRRQEGCIETLGLTEAAVAIVDPTTLTWGNFTDAQAAAKVREGAESAVNIGISLNIIADMMDRFGMTPVPLQWRGNIARGKKNDRLDEEVQRRRNAKLPTDRLLDALADISNDIKLPERDLVRQRGVELLMCGGFRINELLTLPRTTWVTEQVLDAHGNQALDRFGKPVERHGLHYWPEKGGATITQVKWLIPTIVDVARRAIDDLLRITATSAAAAKFMAENPGRALLGDEWDGIDPDALLSAKEVARMLNMASKHSVHWFLQSSGIKAVAVKVAGRPMQRGIRKGDIDAWIRRKSGLHSEILPRGEERLALHECLFLVPNEFFHPKNGDTPGTAGIVNDGQISAYLCGNSATRSVFARRDMLDAEGRPFRVNTHQFRHWLDTLLKQGGLNEVQRARFMGRANIRHNETYDHTTPEQRAEQLREAMRGDKALGPVADQARRIRDPVRREEFMRSAAAAGHATDLGCCHHDWSATPCDKHGACGSGCEDLWITKGDVRQQQNAQRLHADTSKLVEAAMAERVDGTYGTDNWLVHHERVLAISAEILRVHADPEIADGTMVRLRKDGERIGSSHVGEEA